MDLRTVVADLVRDEFADLFLGSRCVGCSAGGRPLCAACTPRLAGAPRRAVPRPRPPGLPPTWAATAYNGIARAAIVAHKEDGVMALAAPLGDALATAIGAAADAVDTTVTLVPIPSTGRTIRRRGHDPLARIVDRAAVTLRRSAHRVRVRPVLRLARRVADQAGLDAASRQANLDGAFRLTRRRSPLQDWGFVVVVDDVVTTGSTLAEAGRALVRAEVPVKAAAVVAATVRQTATGGS